jgi:hypothetical protein
MGAVLEAPEPHKRPGPAFSLHKGSPLCTYIHDTEMSFAMASSHIMTPKFPFFIWSDTLPAEEDYTAEWSDFTNDAQPSVVQDPFPDNLVSVVSGISKGYSRFRVTECPLWQREQQHCHIFQCRCRQSCGSICSSSPHQRGLPGGSRGQQLPPSEHTTPYRWLRALAYFVALQDPCSLWLAPTPCRSQVFPPIPFFVHPA